MNPCNNNIYNNGNGYGIIEGTGANFVLRRPNALIAIISTNTTHM